jgi:ubiquinone/menaquinone biosynthesis C-methylase UbiE
MGTDRRGKGGEAVRAEYARLAPDYDRRWRAYVERTVDRTLRELPALAGGSLLDVGCGTGRLLERALEGRGAGRGCGVDATAEMLGVARRRLGGRAALVAAEAGALPFADRAFDAVTSSSALHYVADPARACAEMARVLRPGGTLVITDWCLDDPVTRLLVLWLRLRGRPLGRVPGARWVVERLRACGLRAVRVERHRAGAWGLMTVRAVRPPDG